MIGDVGRGIVLNVICFTKQKLATLKKQKGKVE